MRLGARLRSEAGVAIPTVLILLIVGLGLGSSAIVSTIGAQHTTIRNSNYKAAIAAADTGLDRALYRENKIFTTSSLPCVLQGVTQLSAGAAAGDGWCPAVTGTVGDASYSYRVEPWTLVTLLGQQGRQITVVSTGTRNGVSRRISETAFSPIGSSVFGTEGAIGQDGITMNGNTLLDVNAGTNGSFSFNGGGPEVCGDARHGPTGTMPGGHQCTGYDVTQGTVDLPPPDQSQALAASATSRFFTLDPKVGNVTWNSTTRALSLTGGAALLTLGGENYSLCSLSMSGGSTLIMAATAKSKLFFDTPEACGLGDNSTQVSLAGGSKILSTSFNPTAGVYDLPGLYVVGSNTLTTKVSISGNGSEGGEFVLYAPRSDVTMSGNAAAGGHTVFQGAIAGKTLTMNGNAQISYENLATLPDIPTLLLYVRQRYVECTGATPPPDSPPDSHC